MLQPAYLSNVDASSLIASLGPAIHHFGIQNFFMDARVKPADDELRSAELSPQVAWLLFISHSQMPSVETIIL
jgi:hypothetical protein